MKGIILQYRKYIRMSVFACSFWILTFKTKGESNLILQIEF